MHGRAIKDKCNWIHLIVFIINLENRIDMKKKITNFVPSRLQIETRSAALNSGHVTINRSSSVLTFCSYADLRFNRPYSSSLRSHPSCPKHPVDFVSSLWSDQST